MRAEGFCNEIALRLAAGALVFAALSQAGIEQASAQQTPAVSQQFSGSGPGTENNDEDFTRPENLIQTRFVYQTAPGSGTLPGTMRTVTTGTMVCLSGADSVQSLVGFVRSALPPPVLSSQRFLWAF